MHSGCRGTAVPNVCLQAFSLFPLPSSPLDQRPVHRLLFNRHANRKCSNPEIRKTGNAEIRIIWKSANLNSIRSRRHFQNINSERRTENNRVEEEGKQFNCVDGREKKYNCSGGGGYGERGGGVACVQTSRLPQEKS